METFTPIKLNAGGLFNMVAKSMVKILINIMLVILSRAAMF